MGKIRAPYDIVYPNDRPHHNTDFIVLKAHIYIAMEEVAGKEAVLESIRRNLAKVSVVEVHHLHEMGRPGKLMLHTYDPKLRVTLEHAGEYHRGQGTFYPIVIGNAE